MEDVLRKRLSHASSSSGRGAPTKGFSKRMLEVRSCTSWVAAGRAGAVWLFRCGYCGFIDLLPMHGLGDLTVKQQSALEYFLPSAHQCFYQYSILITLIEILNIFGVKVVEIRPRGSINDS
jgi:hypothetical protein